MSVLRVEKLFRVLSLKEREAFEQSLQAAAPSQQKLYAILQELETRQTALAKAKLKVCKRLYEEPYTKEIDARFRDDCRKLSERIKHFLAEQRCVQALSKNPLLEARFRLEALLERQLWMEFEADCRKARADALAAGEYENLMAIELLRVRQLWESKPHTPETLKEVLLAIQESETYLKEQYASLYAHLGTFYAAAAHYLGAYEQVARWPTLQTVEFSEVRPPLAQYYELKAKVFEETHRANLERMKEALDIIMRLPSYSPSLCKEQQAALANMGLAYMLNGNYDAAHRYYQKAFEFSEAHHIEFEPQMVFNYASVLMKRGDYRSAIQLFEAKWASFTKSDMLRQRAEVVRCFCHIFLGELNSASEWLPQSQAAYPEAIKNYFRYAEVAILFEKKHLLAAQRAVESILKRLRRHASDEFLQNEKQLVNLYRKLIAISLQKPDKVKSDSHTKLRDELEALLHQQPHYRSALPVVWLEQKLRCSSAD